MVFDTTTKSMITEILGFLPSTGKVIAEDCDGNFYAADPKLVAELATGGKLDPKRACVHAMLHHDEGWRWEEFKPSNPSLFRWTLRAFNRERYGFAVKARRDINDPAVILGA
jgi:hypothetical protein